MIRLDIDDRKLQRDLEEVASRLRDLGPLMRELAGDLADAVEEQFAEEGVPRWPPLAPSTIRQRARRGKWPGKILQVTGRLAAAITTRWSRNEAAAGTSVVYGVYHQLGTRRMPARPFLRLSPGAMAALLDRVERWLSSR